ncbi:hypothetical protein ABN028_32240 [Actinopolymorpha sp. B17G11]|uniref:hypothetical protein n=1 Tax=Actinopolymorpha sp. B17G11 TaxID=3160861 RepID=UPI0032E4F44B
MPDHDDAGSRPHVGPVPPLDQDRLVLGKVVDDGESSAAEIGYYEAFSDPLVRKLDEIRQRRAGQYLRRMRRRRRPQSHGRRDR